MGRNENYSFLPITKYLLFPARFRQFTSSENDVLVLTTAPSGKLCFLKGLLLEKIIMCLKTL